MRSGGPRMVRGVGSAVFALARSAHMAAWGIGADRGRDAQVPCRPDGIPYLAIGKRCEGRAGRRDETLVHRSR